MKKRSKKTQEETPMEEKSTLHIKDAYDYQGLYCFFCVCVSLRPECAEIIPLGSQGAADLCF